ncbi:arginine serine rich splicing factor sf4, partial [Nannochloropsis gaditana CCMP526]|uniref:arginine serine rich splicing factor sf4 n=1 Tax=Nannochloropsis gaditana (strain CCMP526) TaxID=1093141 RepID=UPI00029F7B90
IVCPSWIVQRVRSETVGKHHPPSVILEIVASFLPGLLFTTAPHADSLPSCRLHVHWRLHTCLPLSSQPLTFVPSLLLQQLHAHIGLRLQPVGRKVSFVPSLPCPAFPRRLQEPFHLPGREVLRHVVSPLGGQRHVQGVLGRLEHLLRTFSVFPGPTVFHPARCPAILGFNGTDRLPFALSLPFFFRQLLVVQGPLLEELHLLPALLPALRQGLQTGRLP